MKTILAIDPGASGGLAVLHESAIGTGPDQIHVWPMPATEGDLLSMVTVINRYAVSANNERVAYLEEVGGFCGVGQPGSSMFKFGRGFGFILGVLMATGWRVELVKPQKWQKSFGLGTKAGAGGNTAWKNKLKAMAQRLYPAAKVTLKTADALLILDYAKQQQAP